MIHAKRPVRVAVVYYSATGNVHALARAVAEGAAREGAEVRLRHVAELNEEMLISVNQYWGRHRSELEDQPDAQLEDLEWADGIAFGTPTRFGNVAAQLKVFLDLAGELWQQGRLIDKVATAFTSSQTEHGGQESTILALNNTLYHWGAIVLPLGYTVHEVFNGGGNPYGTSFTSDHRAEGPGRGDARGREGAGSSSRSCRAGDWNRPRGRPSAISGRSKHRSLISETCLAGRRRAEPRSFPCRSDRPQLSLRRNVHARARRPDVAPERHPS